jgi:hypothetical protein
MYLNSPRTLWLHLAAAFSVAVAVGCGTASDNTMRPNIDAGDVAELGSPDSALAGCVVVVEPASVDMGRVDAGTTSCVDLAINNVGDAACSIVGYTLTSESGAFTAEAFSSVYPEGVVSLGPAGGDAGVSELFVEVCFAPETNTYDNGLFEVSINSAQGSSQLEVALVANDGFACIEVAPTLAFGAVRVGFDAVEELTVTHCGAVDSPDVAPLVVSDIRWADTDADAVFEILPQSLPLELEPGESATVAVRYRPADIGVESAQTLEIATNDEMRPVAEVEVSGRAVDPACPTAVPLCTIYRGTEAPSNQIVAAPTDTLQCDASASEDLNGEIVEYRWEVLRGPPASRSRFDTPNSVTSGFFVDVPGDYELQLTTVDDDGCESPRPGRVTVAVPPEQDIQIVLVWDTPGDRDQTDSFGADVDLHFLHPSGCWENTTWDVHFRSPRPNWGDQLRQDDDPSLVIDSVDGTGPEIISFDDPEDGVRYRVGVHYWNDWGFGPSNATLLIYIRGGLAGVFTLQNMRGEQFWEVASITWPSGEVEKTDLVFDDVEEAVCP